MTVVSDEITVRLRGEVSEYLSGLDRSAASTVALQSTIARLDTALAEGAITLNDYTVTLARMGIETQAVEAKTASAGFATSTLSRSLGSLDARALGVSGRFGMMGAMLGRFAVGGEVTLAVLAGMAAVEGIMHLVEGGADDLAKALDKSAESARKAWEGFVQGDRMAEAKAQLQAYQRELKAAKDELDQVQHHPGFFRGIVQRLSNATGVDTPNIETGVDTKKIDELQARIAQLETAIQGVTTATQVYRREDDGLATSLKTTGESIGVMLRNIGQTLPRIDAIVNGTVIWANTNAKNAAIMRDQTDDLDVWKETITQLHEIVQSGLTPLQKYEQALADIQHQMVEGLIPDTQLYTQAVETLERQIQEAAIKQEKEFAKVGKDIGDALVRGLIDAILSGGKGIGNVFKSLLRQLLDTAIQVGIKVAIGAATGGVGAVAVPTMPDFTGLVIPSLAGAVPAGMTSPVSGTGAAPAPGSGGVNFNVDLSKLSAPMTPFESARDRQWLTLLRESVLQMEAGGFRFARG